MQKGRKRGGGVKRPTLALSNTLIDSTSAMPLSTRRRSSVFRGRTCHSPKTTMSMSLWEGREKASDATMDYIASEKARGDHFQGNFVYK